jgi:hypothetical protein
MFKFLARILGLLFVAAGFVGLVIDGTRSIANSEVTFTPLSELGLALFPKSFPLLEPAARHVLPILWDPILVHILLLPGSLVGIVLGAILLWLGRRRPEPVGYQADA